MGKGIFKNKNFWVIVASILLLTAIIIGVGYMLKDAGKKEPETKVVVPVEPNDRDVQNTFGHNKEDAIKAVKQAYNSDSYKFSAEVRGDNKFVVTVTNDATKTKTIYLVEPDTLSYRVIPEEN